MVIWLGEVKKIAPGLGWVRSVEVGAFRLGEVRNAEPGLVWVAPVRLGLVRLRRFGQVWNELQKLSLVQFSKTSLC